MADAKTNTEHPAAKSKRKAAGQKKTKRVKTKITKDEEQTTDDVEVEETQDSADRVMTARRERISKKAKARQEQPTEEAPREPDHVASMKITDVAGVVYDKDEYEQMVDMYDSTIRDIKEGEIVNGTILGVSRDDVIVDVGFKSEGIIPVYEFQMPVNLKVGDEIEVFLEQIEDANGQLVLSKQKADFMRVWDKIRDIHDSGETIQGIVSRRIKGGLILDLMGVDAFLPGSQVALRQVPDFDALIDDKMDVKIIKLNKARRNIVVSRRVVLEEEREEMRGKLLEEIEVGQVRKGMVKNVTDFGVFIDLGGVDGLLHITDMSWGRIRHPSELVTLGESIDVKILDYDEETSRISLGLKQLTPYPWENIEEKYPVGKKVTGRVVSITDYGAFVELEKGIEGLIHISEMSWTQHIKHPSKIMNVNDQVEAVVLSVDKENEKISLGIKQMEPDPWETIEEKYPVGAVVQGKVRNLTAFGAFVELEEGIDGLVHISDMSWTRRVQHPSEVVKKGDTIDVKIIRIDNENRRISLGIKQLSDDPWGDLAKKYSVGSEVLGTVTKILDRGVVVELDGEIEGFVPQAQLGSREEPNPEYEVGQEIPLQVIEFDRSQHKIILSVTAYYKKRERASGGGGGGEQRRQQHEERQERQERREQSAPRPPRPRETGPTAMAEAMPEELKAALAGSNRSEEEKKPEAESGDEASGHSDSGSDEESKNE